MKVAAIIEAVEIVRDSMMDYRGAFSEAEKNAAVSVIIKWADVLLNIDEPKNKIVAERLRFMIQASQGFLHRREQSLLEAM